MTMLLRSSPTSPFGRKVKLAAMITGHYDKLTIVTSDTLNPDDPLRSDNPLGKIPCLIIDGKSIYDSRVIVEFFDQDAGGGKVLPKEWPARLEVLRLQALADGITDAAILKLYESRFRAPEHHEAKWLAYQNDKVERGLALLEANPPKASASPDIGTIMVACFLDWAEFRFKLLSENRHPRLAAFLADMSRAMPGFDKTSPSL